jgi:DNA gyrase inhibitor GyrI
MLTILFIVLVTVVVTTITYFLAVGGSYEVTRTRVFDQDIATVFDKIKDLKSYPEWNPWLIHDLNAQISFSDNCDQEGGSYSWSGDIVGEGTLTHVSIEDSLRIIQHVELVRPVKRVNDISFVVTARGEKTNVAWTMRGEIPFLLRYMKRKVMASITQDFDLGLLKLARVFDPNFESPIIDFHGVVEFPAVHCLTNRFVGRPHQMAVATEKEFPKLVKYVEKQKCVNGRPMTVYRKYNMANLKVDCTFAVPATMDIDPGAYKLEFLGGGDYLKVTMKGNYYFLGLAWYETFTHLQMRKMVMDYGRSRIEVYENNAMKIEDNNQLETTLYLPVKL